jgi:membrane-bound metal-dependent hydrolase YbcI (DUF457 family)
VQIWTHVVFGTAVGILGARALGVDPGLAYTLGLAVGTAAPNVDALVEPGRKRGASWVGKRGLVERGVTHSAVLVALLGGIAALSGVGALWGLAVGWALHVGLDLWTKDGVQLLAPFQNEWYAAPPATRLRPGRGGLVEGALLLIGGLVILVVYGPLIVERFVR